MSSVKKTKPEEGIAEEKILKFPVMCLLPIKKIKSKEGIAEERQIFKTFEKRCESKSQNIIQTFVSADPKNGSPPPRVASVVDRNDNKNSIDI